MKYAAIQAHREQFSVALMCRALDVSRTGFYASAKPVASARAERDQELRTRIRIVHQESRRTYGSPRVHAELHTQGERCGRKRVARLMREQGVRVKVRRRMRPTTNAWALKRGVRALGCCITVIAGCSMRRLIIRSC